MCSYLMFVFNLQVTQKLEFMKQPSKQLVWSQYCTIVLLYLRQ